MFAGVSEIGRLLVGAGESEFGRGVQWIQLQGMLEGVDGLGILFALGV